MKKRWSIAFAVLGLGCSGGVVTDPSDGAGGGGGAGTTSSAATMSTTSTTASGTTTTTTTTTTSTGPEPCSPEEQAALAEQALAELASCMSYQDWIDAGMSTVPATPTLNGIPCQSCHNAGTGGVTLNADPLVTFEWHRDVGRTFIAHATAPGCAAQMEVSTDYMAYGGGGSPHPKYDFTSAQMSLQAFFDVTYAKWSAGPGPCPP